MSISLFRNVNSFPPMSGLMVTAYRESRSRGPRGGGEGGGAQLVHAPKTDSTICIH